jgi:carbonic anhydrase
MEKPGLIIDTYFKSVRLDGNFGVIKTPRGNYQASHVHFVTKSLHELDGASKQVEMMIVHEFVEPSMLSGVHFPPPSDKIDTIIVSVFLDDVAGGASSDLLEAIGFTPNEVVITSDWQSKAKSEGLKDYATKSLSDYLGPVLTGDYYSYQGSLPIPPCWENVLYYVSSEVMPVSHQQVQGLVNVIRATVPAYTPRPVQPLKKAVVVKNTFAATDFNANWADESCADLPAVEQELTSICWRCPAGVQKSPVNLVEAESHPLLQEQLLPKFNKVAGFTTPTYRYHAVPAISERKNHSVIVRPQKGHNFGHLNLDGRFYTAKKITVHAVSGMHTINGESFDGEIHIHHYVFGDWLEEEGELPASYEEEQSRRLDAFRGNTNSAADISGGKSYQVIVAIPLKITTNPGAKSLEDLMPNAMRTLPFAAHDDFKTIFEQSDFLQYKGTLIYPKCSDKVTHWIVYKNPLKVNKDQVYTEYPTRSGFDTTPRLAKPADLKIYKNVVPVEAMGSGTKCSDIGENDWTYADTHCWGEIEKPDPNDETQKVVAYPVCKESSMRQSPIAINTSNVVSQPAHGKDTFLNYVKYHPMLHLKVTNTGHTLEIADKTNGRTHMGLGYLTYGDHYYFVQNFNLHFPSEHVINGKQHAAELHIVHQMQQHWGKDAFKGKAANEVLVAAIFFDIGDEENPLLEQMLPSPGEQVDKDWTKTLQEPLDLMRALGPILGGDYYRYDGSFTTPPCSEIIKWFVFRQSLSMSLAQWNSFKALFANPANARPVKPLNDRAVTMNSFKASGEVWDLKTYDYYLDRNYGRDRDKPSSFIVLGGIVGAIVIAVLIMFATFIPQNMESLKGSAGGLTSETSTFLGRALGPYGRLSDSRV